jgi:hypothetical protein
VPYTLKPKFEQHRTVTIRSGSPMRERDVVPLQAALVDALGQMPDLLIEKVRRLPRNEGMIEISAKWLGLDSDQGEVVRTLRDHFPEQALGIEDLLYWVGPSDEVVLLMFAGRHEGRFLTGRMLIGF